MQKKKMIPARIIAASFMAIIIIGTTLLTLPIATTNHQGLSIVDAFFTAASATCVTGLAAVSTAHDLTVFGQCVLLLLIQIGGVGLMTLTTIVAVALGIKLGFGYRLAMKEALNYSTYAGVIRLVKSVIHYTMLIEGIGALLLWIKFTPIYGLGKGLWYGVFHAISAFNNAGFDLFGNSLEGFQGDWFVLGVIMCLIVLGGLGFAVVAEIISQFHKKNEPFHFKRFGLHTQVVVTMTALLIGIGALTILVVEFTNPATLGALPFDEKVLNALFQSVTCRTAGFNSLALAEMHDSTLLVMIFLMFIGASPGSTGGGIKTTTIGIVLMAVYAIVRGREDLIVFGRRIPINTILKALAVIVISCVLIIAWLIALSLAGNQDLLPLSFEVISAFSTTGLSMGITSSLNDISKIMLAVLMFVGRIGPLTLALALTKRSKDSKIKYPEGRIMIG